MTEREFRALRLLLRLRMVMTAMEEAEKEFPGITSDIFTRLRDLREGGDKHVA